MHFEKLVIRFVIEFNIHSLNYRNLTKKSVSDNVENTTRHIPVRSRRDAMELALALASQSIHPTISKTENNWSLEVDEAEFESANRIIEQYRQENRNWRGWKWQHHLPVSDLWFHAGSIFWCATIVTLYYWNKIRFPQLETLGIMDSAAVNAGQWWRLFTAVTLHADGAHLAANVSTGFLLIGIAMASYGAGFGLAAAYLAGAGGNLAALFIYPTTHRSLGASGMVMAALGLAATQTVIHWKRNLSLRNRLIIRSFAAAVSILLLLGLNPNSDVIAHVGGFVFGCVLGCALHLLPRSVRENTTLNQICVLLTVSWVIFTWWLAMN